MSDPFYWTRPEGYPHEQCAEEGWYQWTERGLIYLGKTAIKLEDIDEAAAAMLKNLEDRAMEELAIRNSRITELETENSLLKAGAEKLEDMAEQFRIGEAAYELGKGIDDKPVGDLFRIGYAWAAYFDQVLKIHGQEVHIAELEGYCQAAIDVAANGKIRLEAAEARIAELERVLRMVEFSGDYPYDPCLWCNGYAKNGHAPDCPRQKVLGEKLVEG